MLNQTNILEILDHSPSIALLRARSSKIILEFFISIFNENTAISHENVHSQLADFLNNHGIEEDDEKPLYKQYEELLIKAENDIRKHIKVNIYIFIIIIL